MASSYGLTIFQAFQVLALTILIPPSVNSLDSSSAFDESTCPEISPGLYGDLLLHEQCTWPGRGHHRSSRAIQDDKDWKAKLAKITQLYTTNTPLHNQFFRSARDPLTSVGDYVDSQPRAAIEAKDKNTCPDSCVAMPTCCQVSTEIAFPMFGLSLTANKVVEIIQGKESFAQPIAYRKCTSNVTSLVQGRCQQTVLPRMVYVVPDSKEGGPLKMDLIDVPSNCDCIVSLAQPVIPATPPLASSPRT